MSELLPCPFCGAHSNVSLKDHGAGDRYMKCGACGAEGPTGHGGKSPEAMWNTRHAPSGWQKATWQAEALEALAAADRTWSRVEILAAAKAIRPKPGGGDED